MIYVLGVFIFLHIVISVYAILRLEKDIEDLKEDLRREGITI